jgi:uncharacterized protein YbjQ (UPF0145 family)
VAGVLIWLALTISKLRLPAKHLTKGTFEDQAKRDVEHIFNDEFREELRNRGRLHFEKIIGENAMFLQQDLRLTTSQVNEYIKKEITEKLQGEFTKYEQTISDAKQIAIDSITKTNTQLEQESHTLSVQLHQEFDGEKARMIKRFDEHMAEIVNYYVLSAVGNQVDLNDQLEFILKDLQENKEDIFKDINNGA